MYKITLLERTGVASQYRSQGKNHSELQAAVPPRRLAPLPSPPAPHALLIVSKFSCGGGSVCGGIVTFQFTVPNNSFAHSINTLFIAS